MDTKKIRAKLLDLAVRGKLVPQDPTDEPASALLNRIRKERCKLIKEKKAKAPKGGDSVIYLASDGSRYEKRGSVEPVCIDDEIPFDVPESWEWARLFVLLVPALHRLKQTRTITKTAPCLGLRALQPVKLQSIHRTATLPK